MKTHKNVDKREMKTPAEGDAVQRVELFIAEHNLNPKFCGTYFSYNESEYIGNSDYQAHL